MKIIVIGGKGLIGSGVVERLKAGGHDVVAASRSSGVDVTTGAGVADVLRGANVLVDVSNSPSFEDAAVRNFFESSTRNLTGAAKAAGVGHYVALSIVGVDRIPDSGYMRAKVAQENLIKAGGVPFTIVRATQFFEFAATIAEGSVGADGVLHSPPAKIQPIAAADVIAIVADVATAKPANATIDIAGPDVIRMDDLIRLQLASTGDPRTIRTDPNARYFGAAVDDQSLVPLGDARLGSTHFEAWLKRAPK